MTLEERLKAYSDLADAMPAREEKIQETLSVSKTALDRAQAETPLSGMDFLVQQAGFIQKRWWLAQFLLLAGLWGCLYANGSSIYERRIMGIAAPLFALLLLPELGKSRRFGTDEIEAASYFSIRKVYAARLLLFAMTDVLMLSVFFLMSSAVLKGSFMDIVVQFFLPMNVTCCICFRSLCYGGEDPSAFALIASLSWATVWVLVVLQERIYRLISAPMWGAAVALSIVYLIYSLRRVWNSCGEYWEVNRSWN